MSTETPTVESPLTIEQALAELREIFPRQTLRLEFQITSGGKLRVFFVSLEFEVIGSKSLERCMAQVRARKQEQADGK